MFGTKGPVAGVLDVVRSLCPVVREAGMPVVITNGLVACGWSKVALFLLWLNYLFSFVL